MVNPLVALNPQSFYRNPYLEVTSGQATVFRLMYDPGQRGFRHAMETAPLRYRPVPSQDTQVSLA
jgi:hypothetical protein